MKSYHLVGTVCLLLLADLCFAQGSFDATKFQIGLSNYSYFSNQYKRNLEDQYLEETYFASRWGLTTSHHIGEHFGIGLTLQYRRRQDDNVLPIDHRLMVIYVPVEERYQEFTHHLALIDVFGRWYMQARTARLRTYVQIGLAAEASLGGNTAFPLSKSEEAQQTQKIETGFNGFLPSLGFGLQYRLTQNWSLESALTAYWPGSLPEQIYGLNQYGLQIGVFRTF